MGDIVLRLAWFVIATTALSYGSYTGVTYFLNSVPGGEAAPMLEIVDQLRPGVHQLTGTITVPSACNELKVRVENTAPNVYTLVFQTWEDPYVPCAKTPVPRNFGTTAFAPAVGVQFEAQLDGESIPVVVRPSYVPDRSSSSIVIAHQQQN